MHPGMFQEKVKKYSKQIKTFLTGEMNQMAIQTFYRIMNLTHIVGAITATIVVF